MSPTKSKCSDAIRTRVMPTPAKCPSIAKSRSLAIRRPRWAGMMKSEAEHPRLQEFFPGINLNLGFGRAAWSVTPNSASRRSPQWRRRSAGVVPSRPAANTERAGRRRPARPRITALGSPTSSLPPTIWPLIARGAFSTGSGNRQLQIINDRMQAKPAIFALSRACIARGTGRSNPSPSSRESATNRGLQPRNGTAAGR